METEEQLGKMEMQLDQLGSNLDELAAKAEKAGSVGKVRYHKRIDHLKKEYETVYAELQVCKAKDNLNWFPLKAEL